ncbi:hypothetical protein V2W45_1440260, partial [Cenococcum geophilum]
MLWGSTCRAVTLFPTVRSRRLTEQRVYLSTERSLCCILLHLPTNRSIERRPFNRP